MDERRFAVYFAGCRAVCPRITAVFPRTQNIASNNATKHRHGQHCQKSQLKSIKKAVSLFGDTAFLMYVTLVKINCSENVSIKNFFGKMQVDVLRQKI